MGDEDDLSSVMRPSINYWSPWPEHNFVDMTSYALSKNGDSGELGYTLRKTLLPVSLSAGFLELYLLYA